MKIQALVRGFLVRKQAAATFHSMQALIRAQAAVRARRIFLKKSHPIASQHSKRLSSSFDATTIDEIPKIVEVDNGRSRSYKLRSRRTYSLMLANSGYEYSLGKAALASLEQEWSPVPAKSYYGRYMSKMPSFKTKVRSQSAPRQSRVPVEESRSSLSGVSTQTVNFKNAVLGKLGRSYDHFHRETHEFYHN